MLVNLPGLIQVGEFLGQFFHLTDPLVHLGGKILLDLGQFLSEKFFVPGVHGRLGAFLKGSLVFGVGLFLDLHRVLEKGVRSRLLFLDGFFGLCGEDLFLLCQFFFLELFGLESELFNENDISGERAK